MSVRTKVLGMVDVIMRVPPLFVIDEILKISMGLTTTSIGSDSSQQNSINSSITTPSINNISMVADTESIIDHLSDMESQEFFKIMPLTALKFLVCLVGKLYSKTNRLHNNAAGIPLSIWDGLRPW